MQTPLAFLKTAEIQAIWDGELREGTAYATFQDRCLKPLGHPSKDDFDIFWPSQYPILCRCCHSAAESPSASGLYRLLDQRVNLLGGIRLHSRHDVRIEIEGNGDHGMPKPFLCDLGMNAGGKQLAGVGCVADRGTGCGAGSSCLGDVGFGPRTAGNGPSILDTDWHSHVRLAGTAAAGMIIGKRPRTAWPHDLRTACPERHGPYPRYQHVPAVARDRQRRTVHPWNLSRLQFRQEHTQRRRQVLTISIGASAVLLVLTFFSASCVSQVSVQGFVPTLLAYSPGWLAETSLIALGQQIDAGFVVCHRMARVLMEVVGADLAFRPFITSRILLGLHFRLRLRLPLTRATPACHRGSLKSITGSYGVAYSLFAIGSAKVAEWFPRNILCFKLQMKSRLNRQGRLGLSRLVAYSEGCSPHHVVICRLYGDVRLRTHV
jgi:hypothetical protein